MIETILHMAVTMALGVLWRHFSFGGVDADKLRSAIVALVFYIAFPALGLVVMWQADVGLNSLRIMALGFSAVLLGLVLMSLFGRFFHGSTAVMGSLLIAAGFSNASFMGLPLLSSVFGDWAQAIAMQYDLLVMTPLLLTVGAIIAMHYGHTSDSSPLWRQVVKIPALWAMLVGGGLSLSQTPIYTPLADWLSMMGAVVVPLMLFSIGLSFNFKAVNKETFIVVIPVASIQLILIPLLLYPLALQLGLQGDFLKACMLELGLPSMVLGIMIVERYGLDVNVYATAVIVTTLASLFTLPSLYSLI